jgi:hypothetical protein
MWFWNEASWLIIIPLALFNVFFSVILGALMGVMGSVATHIGR